MQEHLPALCINHDARRSFAISNIGVIIFTALTAYDTETIKQQYVENLGRESETRLAVLGALTLYLNVINLFQMLLSLTGQREE